MGNRQDGMWTGRAGEIFGVRREEIGAAVLGDGRRGSGGALLGVWVRGDGERAERSSVELEGRKPICCTHHHHVCHAHHTLSDARNNVFHCRNSRGAGSERSEVEVGVGSPRQS